MFTPLAITVVFFFLVQVMVLLPLAWLVKRFKGNSFLWTASAAVFITLFFIAGSAADLFAFTLSPERIVKALLLAILALTVSAVVSRAMKTSDEKSTFHRWFQSIVFALPFLFFLFMFLAWHLIYHQVPLFSLRFVIAAAIFIAIAAFTLWLIDALPGIPVRMGMVVVLALFVMAGFFIQPASPMDQPFNPGSLEKTSPRYIILITIDSLRLDALSCYNTNHTMTPNIDALAKQSVVFESAVTSSPWTLPAIASLMTGMPPGVHQANRYHQRTSARLPSLAQLLKKNGYYTAAVGVNPNLTKHTGISNGFIYYDFYPKFSTGRSFGSKIRKHLSRYIPDEKLTNVYHETLELDFTSMISTDRLTTLSGRWMTENNKKPFFFWVHYFDPHVPYAPPRQFVKDKKPEAYIGYNFDRPDDLLTHAFAPDEKERQWIKELYDGEVRYVDHSLGRLFATLKEAGIYDESLIVLTSDHGEEFWDHGAYYHGHSLYKELVAVPLLFKLPNNVRSYRVDAGAVVSLRQVMPTILDYCKIQRDKRPIYPPSLLPLLTGKPEDYRSQPVYASAMRYGPEKQAVYWDKWKLVDTPMQKRRELYDMTADPLEKINRSSQEPEALQTAIQLFNDYLKLAKRIIKMFKIDIFGKHQKKTSRAQTDSLKTLGYF
jgi:arylsulfatase A-like enzyme/uncharacterized membrane protein YhdT